MEHYLSRLEKTIRSNWSGQALANYGGSVSYTYGALTEQICRLHLLFEKTGIKKSDRIAISAKNSAQWAVVFLAVNTYEAVAVPILNDFLPESIARLTAHSGCKVIFTDADIWKKIDPDSIPSLEYAVDCSEFTLLYARCGGTREHFNNLDSCFREKYPQGVGPDNLDFPTANEKDLAVINYTSGTTSAPKGVMLRYECFCATIDFSCLNVKIKPGEKIVSMLPMGHIYGLAFEFLFPLCNGAEIHFLGRTPSPSLLVKAMKEIKPFMIVTVPLVMEKIYKSSVKPQTDKLHMKILLSIPIISQAIYRRIGDKILSAFGGNVRLIIMGGAALNRNVEKVFKRMKLPFMVGYGMTEASPLLAWEFPDKFVAGSCGKAVSCADVRIDSSDPETIAGEIQAKGMNICSGYYNNPEANSLAFTDDGYLRTGDLGIMDKEGNIFIKGRSKTMILSANGQNIYPEDIESVVNSQDYVAESLVLDRAGKLVALIYLDSERINQDKLDEEAVSDIPERVRINSNRQLPGYSRITKVEVVVKPFEKTPKLSIKRFLYK